MFILCMYVHVCLSLYAWNIYTYFLSHENIAYRLLFPDVLFSLSLRRICISAGRGTGSSNVAEYVFEQ